MIGIYCITNQVNGCRYIGATVDIHARWMQHKANARNPNCKEYDKPLYQAMRQFGIKQFQFAILEECTAVQLQEREKYWINQYQTVQHGYNQTPGGTGVRLANQCEKHPNHKLTLEDVIAIRTAYQQHQRKCDVYAQYAHKINQTGFHKVWNGVTWSEVMPEVYTTDNISFHTNNTGNPGSRNGRAKLTEEDVRTIRMRRKNGEAFDVVYQDFVNKTTRGSFKNVWFYQNWKTIIV